MVSIKESIIEILRDSHTQLHYSDIHKKLIDLERINNKSKKEGIHVIINNDIKKNGDESPFIKCKEKGFFKLNNSFNIVDFENLGNRLSLQREARQFEERMKSLLEKMEFDKVDGARNDFIVGGHQIDVAALHEKSIIIFECKMSKEIKEKSMRKIICEFRGKIQAIQEGFKKMPFWNKAVHFRFVLLVNKNIQIRQEDKDLARELPDRIYLMKEDALEYYNELYSFLRPYSKYNFLGELHIKPFHSDPIIVPCFKIKYGDGYMYSFAIDPKKLIQVTYVARRERGYEKYYQRLVKRDRLSKIKKYIAEGGRFPNNIIISFNNEPGNEIKFFKKHYSGEINHDGFEFGELQFPYDYRSCWIVDGQHRLFAYVDPDVPPSIIQVSAFEGMDLNEQGKLFLDINKNQKPVPTDLLWDLCGELTPEEEDGIISRAVRWLNYTDRQGPLFHHIYFPSLGLRSNYSQLIKVAGICLSLKRAGIARLSGFTKSQVRNPLFNENPNVFYKNIAHSLSEYFQVVKEIFREDWELKTKGFVLDDGGVSMLIRLFEKIIRQSIENSFNLNKENYKRYLISLEKFMKSNYSSPEKLKELKRTHFSSESSRDELLEKICIFIRSDLHEPTFGGKIQEDNFKDDVEILEREIGKFLSDVLSKEDANWEKSRVPEPIYLRVKERIKKKLPSDKRKEFHEFLTLGEIKNIIERKDNLSLLNKNFLSHEKGFESEELLIVVLDTLTKYRNPAHHGGIEFPPEKKSQLDLWIAQIRNCINLENDSEDS